MAVIQQARNGPRQRLAVVRDALFERRPRARNARLQKAAAKYRKQMGL
jgi:hypothetical protein